MIRNMVINIDTKDINNLIRKYSIEILNSKNNKTAVIELSSLSLKISDKDKRKMSTDYKRNLSKISDLIMQNVVITILQGMDMAIKSN